MSQDDQFSSFDNISKAESQHLEKSKTNPSQGPQKQETQKQPLRPNSATEGNKKKPILARPASAKALNQKLLKTEQNKEKTNEFFKETKVGACAHVIVVNGVPKAVPFYDKPKKTYAEMMGKFGYSQSLSQEQFKVHANVTLGSPKKPLVPYHPDAQRNRIQQVTLRPPQTNASQIQFGDGSANKRHFVSSSKNAYGNFANFGFTSNPAILQHRTANHKNSSQK